MEFPLSQAQMETGCPQSSHCKKSLVVLQFTYGCVIFPCCHLPASAENYGNVVWDIFVLFKVKLDILTLKVKGQGQVSRVEIICGVVYVNCGVLICKKKKCKEGWIFFCLKCFFGSHCQKLKSQTTRKLVYIAICRYEVKSLFQQMRQMSCGDLLDLARYDNPLYGVDIFVLAIILLN